eukprot:g3983.t1
MGSQISAAQLASVLNRLRVLRVPVHHDFLHSLASSVLQKRNDFHSKALAFIWLSFSRLQFDDPEFFDELAQESMKLNNVEACKPADISNVIFSVGQLQKSKEQRQGIRLKPIGRGPRSEQIVAFPLQYELLETYVQKTVLTNHPARLNEIQIVSSVYGLGLAKFNDLKSLQPVLQEATGSDRLARYSIGELSNLLYGLVLLSLDKTDALLEGVIQEITKEDRLKTTAEQELTCLMYCLRLLGVKETSLLDRIRHEIIQPYRLMHLSERGLSMITSNLRVLGVIDAATMGPLLKEITSERILTKLTNQGLAMALYNYASCEFRDDLVLDKLVQLAMTPSMVMKFTTNDISNLMYALSAVRYSNVEVLTPLKQRLSDPTLISRFQPGHVANFFYGSGKLGFSDSLPYALDEVTKPEKLPTMSPSQLVQIIHGMGHLGLQDQSSLDKVLDQLIPQISQLVSNQLANVVFSLGKMGYKDHDRLSTVMTEIIKTERVTQFTESGLCTTLHGLASSGFRIGAILGGLLQEIIRSTRLTKFSNAHLALMVYSIGKIGIEDHRVVQPMLSEILTGDRLSQMDKQGLTNILYGLSQLEQFDEQVWQQLTSEVSLPHRIESFKALDLSLIFYAYGMKKLRDPVLHKLIIEIQKPERLEEFTTVGLASTLYSLAQLEMEEMEATPHHIGNVVYALGLLNYRNKDTMKLLKTEVLKEERLTGFSRRALHNLVFGFGQLKYKSEQILNALWKEMMKLERLVGFTEREWNSIAFSLNQLQFKEEDEVISLRTRILNSRGLSNVKIEHKTELTAEDLRQIRNTNDQQKVTESFSRDQTVISHLSHKDPEPAVQSMAYQRPVGPPLHPTESSSSRRPSRKPGSKFKRQVMVFNQTSPEFSDDESPSVPLERSNRHRSNRVLTPWITPHYNTRFQNWPTGRNSTRVVESDFVAKQSSSDSDENEGEIQFEDVDKSDPLSAVRHLAEPRKRGGMTKSSSLKEMMMIHGRQVRQKDEQVMNDLVDGLTDIIRNVKK